MMSATCPTTNLPVILLAADDTAVLRHLSKLLMPAFAVRAATSWERALRAATHPPLPHVVLNALPYDPAQRAALAAALPGVPILEDPLPLHFANLCARFAPPAGNAPSSAAPSPLAGRRALVAEDNDLLNEATCAFLESLGIGTASARDGNEALALARIKRFDWVLMDVQMPNLDGLAATRRLRTDPRTATLCVIALTAANDAAARAACREAGMSDFQLKPLEPDTLHTRLLHWLDRPHELLEKPSGVTMQPDSRD